MKVLSTLVGTVFKKRLKPVIALGPCELPDDLVASAGDAWVRVRVRARPSWALWFCTASRCMFVYAAAGGPRVRGVDVVGSLLRYQLDRQLVPRGPHGPSLERAGLHDERRCGLAALPGPCRRREAMAVYLVPPSLAISLDYPVGRDRRREADVLPGPAPLLGTGSTSSAWW